MAETLAGPSHVQSFPKLAFKHCGRRQHTDHLAHAIPTKYTGRAASGKSSEATLSQSCTASCKSTHPRGRLAVCGAAVSAAPSASATLSDLDLVPILNLQGMIEPEVPAGTAASVFAIFDEGKKLQFVGFSKDLRNSLRTVFSRRPDKAFFYKAINLPQLDQNEMVAIRTAWFEEVGGAPTGNKLAMERKAWSEPVAAGAISERGRQQAAESQAAEQLVQIKARGCKEEFIAKPDLLAEGKVDFEPAAALTEEELAARREAAARMSKATRTIAFTLDEQPAQFEMRIRNNYKTNGGRMFDVDVTFEDRETRHRVIIGKEYYEEFGLEPEDVLAMTFSFLLRKKTPRQTEGMLLSSQFNINYFAISEVDQWWSDFVQEWTNIGKTLEGDGKFWRMNRLHGYGGLANDLERDLAKQ
ncbi:g11167 [Coccomyxa elongata]